MGTQELYDKKKNFEYSIFLAVRKYKNRVFMLFRNGLRIITIGVILSLFYIFLFYSINKLLWSNSLVITLMIISLLDFLILYSTVYYEDFKENWKIKNDGDES